VRVADFAISDDLHVVFQFVNEVASGAVGAVALFVVQFALSGSVVLVDVDLSLQLGDAVGVSALGSVVAELVLFPVSAHLGLVLDLVQRVPLGLSLLLGALGFVALKRAEAAEVRLSVRVVVVRILVSLTLGASAAHLVFLDSLDCRETLGRVQERLLRRECELAQSNGLSEVQ